MHGIHLGTARSRWSRIIAGVALLAFTTGTLLVVTESSLSASTSTSLPAHTPPSHAPSWNLEHVTFSSATMGYGVFQRESWTGQSCEDFVGKTGDGGVHFTSLVRAMSWNCNRSFFDSSLVVDAYGNGFLFGPSLFVTHDAGASWTRSANVDLVLAVDTIGRSVWLVESTCRNSQLAKYYDCRAKLLASTNGGRTWATLPSLPKVLVDTGEASANGQTYLVRVSKLEAYVLGRPPESVRGKPVAAPLWFTSNGGRTWSNRQIPCGLNAFSAVLAAAPDGTLEAVCAGGPSAGFQPKSALRSTNGGRSWAMKVQCVVTRPKSCSSELNSGYLGQIVALTSQTDFEVGDRSLLLVTHDGGARWLAVKPYVGAAGGTSQVLFFNRSRGVVVVGYQNQLLVTSDGGQTWRRIVVKR